MTPLAVWRRMDREFAATNRFTNMSILIFDGNYRLGRAWAAQSRRYAFRRFRDQAEGGMGFARNLRTATWPHGLEPIQRIAGGA